MLPSLLDVNVLVALFDPLHIHHEAAQVWIREECEDWATCPLTTLGLVRILSNPGYRDRFASEDIAERLREACAVPEHQWWPADVSIADDGLFDLRAIQGHRHLTDVYLLALAVKHKGQLVSFDRTIPWRAVRGAKASHLKLLGQKQ